MEQTEEKIIQAKKYNSKIYPLYKMFAWDLLFYYSIIFLFLTQTKGFSASNVLFIDSFYPLFKLILQIPCVNIVETLGKRKSLILGNLLIAACILVVILAKDIPTMIFSNFLMAFGYAIKSLCESSLLSDCVTEKEHPRTVFSNIDGKGSAYWYYLDAITAVSCGFLFVVNNYLPMFLCLTSCVISCILRFKFLPYENPNVRTKLEDETGSCWQADQFGIIVQDGANGTVRYVFRADSRCIGHCQRVSCKNNIIGCLSLCLRRRKAVIHIESPLSLHIFQQRRNFRKSFIFLHLGRKIGAPRSRLSSHLLWR